MLHLSDPTSILGARIGRRMSWVSKRTTTRMEDMAYCLLGVFDINMPLIYGEGPKAFIRLQEEIIKHNNEHTIFCWALSFMKPHASNPTWRGCLAPDPSAFRNGSNYYGSRPIIPNLATDFLLSNSGLEISIPLLSGFGDGYKVGVVKVRPNVPAAFRLCMWLYREGSDHNVWVRSDVPGHLVAIPTAWTRSAQGTWLSIAHQRNPHRRSIATGILNVSDETYTPLHFLARLLEVWCS